MTKQTIFTFACKFLIRSPRLGLKLTAKTLRYLIHPLERCYPDGISLPPRSLHIMVTDVCNLKCRMCQYSKSSTANYQLNRAGHMPAHIFKRIVDTTPGWPIISITGGEPLLHPKIEEYIEYIKTKGYYCTLTTNGWLLKEKIPAINKSGLDMLIISIEGNKQVHDSIRGNGSFDRAIIGLKTLVSSSSRPTICISTVITDLNYHSLDDVINIADEFGVDIINFNHLWIQSDDMVVDQSIESALMETGRVNWEIKPHSIQTDVLANSIELLHRKSKIPIMVTPSLNRHDMRIYYEEPEKLIKAPDSRCAWLNAKVWTNGEVRICREYSAGNVLDRPLFDIWNSKPYKDFRLFLREHDVCPICSRCCFVFPRY